MKQSPQYINTADYLKYKRAFTFVLGSRGIGKSYSSLLLPLERPEYRKMLYLRNTQEQLNVCLKEFANPYKRINLDRNYNVKMDKEMNYAYVNDYTEDPMNPDCIGYAAALSTFNNLRSLDMSDVNLILAEEAIQRQTLMYDQFSAFCNMYETVARNRELEGRPPLQCLVISNTQSLDSPLLRGFNLIPRIEKMKNRGIGLHIDKDYVIALTDGGGVSQMKSDTALYRMTAGTGYYEEALQNDFAYDDTSGVGYQNLHAFTPVCQIDDLYIYKQKNATFYYCCWSRATKIPVYNSKDGLSHFMRAVGMRIRMAIEKGNVSYSDYTAKRDIYKILKLS